MCNALRQTLTNQKRRVVHPSRCDHLVRRSRKNHFLQNNIRILPSDNRAFCICKKSCPKRGSVGGRKQDPQSHWFSHTGWHCSTVYPPVLISHLSFPYRVQSSRLPRTHTHRTICLKNTKSKKTHWKARCSPGLRFQNLQLSIPVAKQKRKHMDRMAARRDSVHRVGLAALWKRMTSGSNQLRGNAHCTVQGSGTAPQWDRKMSGWFQKLHVLGDPDVSYSQVILNY